MNDRLRTDGGPEFETETDTDPIVQWDPDAASHYRCALKRLRRLRAATPTEHRQSTLETLLEELVALFPEPALERDAVELITHSARREVAGTTVVVEARVYDDGAAARDTRERLAEEAAAHGVESSRVKWTQAEEAEGETDGDA
jgi:hypothetical protein